jgi:hypothetical protein
MFDQVHIRQPAEISDNFLLDVTHDFEKLIVTFSAACRCSIDYYDFHLFALYVPALSPRSTSPSRISLKMIFEIVLLAELYGRSKTSMPMIVGPYSPLRH